jgi:hypothetical protein
MKKIKAPRSIKIEAFDEQPAVYTAGSTYESVVKPFEDNKIIIINSAYNIENLLETIITHYFFGINSPDTKDKAEKFKSLILTSDWCSFSSKKKLILQIVNELSLLNGKTKSTYETLLSKVMRFRNAFTHGDMTTNGEIVKLKFYEGQPKTQTVDEQYLTEIETAINECFNITWELALKTGAMFMHKTE